ncbi:Endo-beta-glucanase [Neofusicoccum parvum]|uniref:Endo-beta-glucanase n=1 Tax=Neofusicoccum parvum TaxID=310453 RepID=A0ACB5RXT9_9PEZI|nr:Endo-beta-glucanase [Neofusicoccum parvum]
MLRRPATVISLTADDIVAYEQNRQQRSWQQQQQQGNHNTSYMTDPAFSQSQEAADHQNNSTQERQRATRTREDRILGNSSRG